MDRGLVSQQQRIMVGFAMVERGFQRDGYFLQPGQRRFMGDTRRNARAGAHGGHHAKLVAHAVKHHHDGGAQHDGVGRADLVLLGGRQALHLAHHVIAKVTKDPRSHWRKAFALRRRQLGDQLAQRHQRGLAAGLEGRSVFQRVAVDFGGLSPDAEDHIRIETDHRIASARRSPLDGFEKKSVAFAAPRQFQIGRDRRFEVAHEPDRHERGASLFVIGGDCLVGRLGQLRAHFSLSPPSAAWSAF